MKGVSPIGSESSFSVFLPEGCEGISHPIREHDGDGGKDLDGDSLCIHVGNSRFGIPAVSLNSSEELSVSHHVGLVPSLQVLQLDPAAVSVPLREEKREISSPSVRTAWGVWEGGGACEGCMYLREVRPRLREDVVVDVQFLHLKKLFPFPFSDDSHSHSPSQVRPRTRTGRETGETSSTPSWRPCLSFRIGPCFHLPS